MVVKTAAKDADRHYLSRHQRGLAEASRDCCVLRASAGAVSFQIDPTAE